MAELGDFVCQGRRKVCEVTLEMMDYKYVDKCSDCPELRTILTELKSGKHGKYPHLEQHTEKRILELLPAKDRKKVEALQSKPTPADEAQASSELKDFEAGVAEADERLRTEVYVAKAGKAGDRLPPPRGHKGDAAKPKAAPRAPETYLEEDEQQDKAARIPGYDFRAWDKFDVDGECDKLDEKDKALERARKERAEAARRRDEAKARRALADLSKEREALRADDMAPAERQFLAQREKHKGNEAYRANEARDAYDCYTRALAYDASNPVVFANRAMASLRLGLLEGAEDDCTCALRLDPGYHRARQRRGMTRHKRGKYALAIEDLERAVADDPDNAPLRKLLQQSCDKFEEVEGRAAPRDPKAFVSVAIDDSEDENDDGNAPKFTKIAIADEDSSDDDDDEILEAGADGFELPEPKPADEDDLLARLAADDGAEIGGGSKIAIDESESEEDVPISTSCKIAIDDDDDELLMEEVPVGAESPTRGVKVAICDSGSDDDQGAAPTRVPSSPGAFTDHGDTDEDVPISAGAKVAVDDQEEMPASTGTKIAIDESDDEAAPSTGTKIAIDDDDEPPPLANDKPSALTPLAVDDAPAATSSNASPTSQESWDLVPDPAAAEARKAEGNALMSAGDAAGAVAKYDAALAADASHYASRANRAFARLKTGDLEGCVADATTCLDHADAKDPAKRVKALFRRGDARERLAARSKTPAEAFAIFERAVADLEGVCRLEPTNETALVKKASLMTARARARAEADRAAAVASDNDNFAASDAAKAEGSTALGAGDLAEAERCYSEALRAWPGNRAARNNRALVRLRSENFKGCADDASEVLRGEPDNLKALYRRGVARRALGDLGGSLDDLDKLLQLAPGDRAATAERDATRRKVDERNGTKRVKTKGVVALDKVPLSAPPILKTSAPPKSKAPVVAVDAPPPPPPSSNKAPAPPTPPSAPPKKAPTPPSRKKDSSARMAGAVAAAKARVAETKVKAPKSATELEFAWRTFRNEPEKWTRFLKTFKPQTLKKIDLSLCPDVFALIISTLKDAVGSPASADILANVIKAKSFAVTKALLSKTDIGHIAAIADGADDADVAARLRAGYGC